MPTSNADKPPICRTPVPAGHDAPTARGDSPFAEPAGSVWHHWLFLIMSCCVLAGSLALSVQGEEHVLVPWVNQPLPGTCTFRRLTDLPCPGCGMTRAFISMAHGRLADAWHFNPAGIAFFAIVLFQIPYRILQLRRIRRGLAEYHIVVDHWLVVGAVAVLLVHWVFALAARWG